MDSVFRLWRWPSASYFLALILDIIAAWLWTCLSFVITIFVFIVYSSFLLPYLAYPLSENASTLKIRSVIKNWAQSLALRIRRSIPATAVDAILGIVFLDGIQMWFSFASRRKLHYLSKLMSLLAITSKFHITFFSLQKWKLGPPESNLQGNWIIFIRASSITGNLNLKVTFSNHDFKRTHRFKGLPPHAAFPNFNFKTLVPVMRSGQVF